VSQLLSTSGIAVVTLNRCLPTRAIHNPQTAPSHLLGTLQQQHRGNHTSSRTHLRSHKG
jgi:hypothetical protein